MKLSVRVQSQRNSGWGSIILGYNTQSQYSIYNYGCLITSLGNYIGKDPKEVNQILKDNGGYTAGSGNFVWGKSIALGLTQTYLSPYYNDAVTAQGITKIKEIIGQGYPLLCEVDFNPADTVKQQHFVLLSGVDDAGNILVVDPWEGQWETWSEAACKRNIYQFRAYDKKLSIDSGTPTNPNADLQKQLDDTRKERNRNWTYFSGLCDVMKVAAVYETAKSELEKLVGIEDKYNQTAGSLTEAQKQVNDLRGQLTTINDSHNALQTSYNDLQGQLTKDKDTIDTLTRNLVELEKAVMAPVRKGWKAFLVGLVDRL